MTTCTKGSCVRTIEAPWVAERKLGRDPVPFGVTILAGAWEAIVRRTDGGLALGLMTVDALLLSDHTGLVRRAARFGAPHRCERGDACCRAHEGAHKARRRSPHRLEGTTIF